MKVLIVDDDRLIRKMMRAVFEAEGIECSEASSVAGALNLVLDEHPDVCFLDLYLPDGDGISFLRRLSAMKLPSSAPKVYLVTGSDDTGLAGKAVRNGAAGIFTKPFDPKALLDKVKGG